MGFCQVTYNGHLVADLSRCLFQWSELNKNMLFLILCYPYLKSNYISYSGVIMQQKSSSDNSHRIITMKNRQISLSFSLFFSLPFSFSDTARSICLVITENIFQVQKCNFLSEVFIILNWRPGMPVICDETLRENTR